MRRAQAGKYNPFRPGGIATPEVFAGRTPEMIRLERSLEQARNENPRHFLIAGPRGVGKSSLLSRIRCIAAGEIAAPSGTRFRFKTLSVRLEESDDARDVVRKIAAELSRVMEAEQWIPPYVKMAWSLIKSIETPFFSIGKGTENQPLLHEQKKDVSHALYEADRRLGLSWHGVLVVIDEADRPAEDAQVGRIVRGISEDLAQFGRNRVLIGVAGSDGDAGIVSRFHRSDPSALRAFETISLKAMTRAEAEAVLDQAFQVESARDKQTLFLDDSARECLIAAADGDPSMLQQLAYDAVEEDSDGLVDVRDVLASVFPVLDEPELDAAVARMFLQASRIEAAVLGVMLRKRDCAISEEDIATSTLLPKTDVAKAIAKLTKHALIVPVSDQPGEYKLCEVPGQEQNGNPG